MEANIYSVRAQVGGLGDNLVDKGWQLETPKFGVRIGVMS